MTTRTIPLADATEDELRRFATEALGLPVGPLAKSELIRSRIATCYDRNEIILTVTEDDAPPVASEASTSPPATSAAAETPEPVDGHPADVAEVAEPWYIIMIPETETSDGTDPVPVCPNGRNMFIERGKPQRIKHRYFDALNNAKQKVYEQPDGPQGKTVTREVLSYPFQVIEAPPQAELDAWSKYKADLQAAEVAEKAADARALRGITGLVAA